MAKKKRYQLRHANDMGEDEDEGFFVAKTLSMQYAEMRLPQVTPPLLFDRDLTGDEVRFYLILMTAACVNPNEVCDILKTGAYFGWSPEYTEKVFYRLVETGHMVRDAKTKTTDLRPQNLIYGAVHIVSTDYWFGDRGTPVGPPKPRNRYGEDGFYGMQNFVRGSDGCWYPIVPGCVIP